MKGNDWRCLSWRRIGFYDDFLFFLIGRVNLTTLHFIVHSFLKILMMGNGRRVEGDRDAIASSRIGESDGELCKDDIVLFFITDW